MNELISERPPKHCSEIVINMAHSERKAEKRKVKKVKGLRIRLRNSSKHDGTLQREGIGRKVNG